MSKKTILKCYTMGILPLFFATGAVITNAQDREVTLEEEVIVTGFRKSLETAVDSKRDAKAITDNIYAEDIGKSTDQNIAEALSRVTGVSINREDGEGTTISIRGAGPGLNNISLNGVQLTGFQKDNNNVDLSAYSSDILSRVEIYKSSSADLDEGSLGGTVKLHTFRPLDTEEDQRSVEVQYRTNELAESDDYKISGAFSHKFMDDTLGVALTAYSETSTVRRDQFQSGRTRTKTFPSNKVRDQNGNLLTQFVNDADGNPTTEIADFAALGFDQAFYKSFFNERDRIGGSLGIQFQPTDQTDIQFDLSHSTQTVNTDDNSAQLIGIGNGRDPGDGAILQYYTNRYYADNDIDPNAPTDAEAAAAAASAQNLIDNPPSANDPDNWVTYDTNQGMFTQVINRYGPGRVTRNTNIVDNINTIVSLDIEHTVGDFTFNVLAGHSESEAKDDFYADTNSSNFLSINNTVLYSVPSVDIQPVGYDCRSGRCIIVTGSDTLDTGDGDARTVGDNRRNTNFNPDDFNARHLQQFGIRDRTITDTSDSLFFDVDWDLNVSGFTTLEAGFKFASREKDVDDTRSQYGGNNRSGNDPLIRLSRNVRDILVSEVADSFAIPGFLSGLGYPSDNLTDGWVSVNAAKTLDILVTGAGRVTLDSAGNPMLDADGNEILTPINPLTQITPNRGNSRNVTIDSSALYVKANFDFEDMGLPLSGDFGLRYVKTDNESSGFSKIDFEDGDEVLDLELLKTVTDVSLDVCTANRQFAIDYGIVASEAAYDMLSQQQLKDLAWNPVPPAGETDLPTEAKFDHRDKRDTEARMTPCFDPIVAQRSGGEDWRYRPRDITAITTDGKDRQFEVTGDGSNSQVLPSLNLNYSFSDELVGRLALSKTMARPNMNSLRSGFNLNERIIAEDGNGSIGNAGLKPLISKNFDLSLEWYFNDEGGLLSATLFTKDFEDFEDTEAAPVAVLDVRDQTGTDLEGSNAADFILSNLSDPSCLPNRPWMFTPIGTPEERAPFENGTCRTFIVNKTVNGDGAKVNGLELSYQQNYDMLPGIWGGLGVAMNATFQKTETDKQESSLVPGTFLPQFPLARSPERSFNSTFFWEQNGHLVRLAYNWASDVLVQRSYDRGFALWEEGSGSLDLSASWAVNDWLSVNLNAVNLTDRETRVYITSVTNSEINDALGLPNGEGNALDGNVNKGRTRQLFNTGTVYRLGLRATF